MNVSNIKSLFFLFLIIGLFSCTKEENNQLSVNVTLDGKPINNHFVSLINFKSPAPIAEGRTDADGQVILDTEDYVFLDGELEELLLLSVDKEGCGYTLFQGFDQSYSINLATEEKINIEILAPDLENTTFSVGETIRVKMKLESNYHPFTIKIGEVEAKRGILNNDLIVQRLLLKDLFLDRSGNLEFDYTTVEGENGFFISYNKDLHGTGASDLAVRAFDIKVE